MVVHVSRIAQSPFRRWMFHVNSKLFFACWVLILSAAIPATAKEHLSTGAFPLKQRGGSTVARVPKGRAASVMPKATDEAKPKEMLPATTGTPELTPNSEMGTNAAPAFVRSTSFVAPAPSAQATHSTVAALALAFATIWRENAVVMKTLLAGALSGVLSRTCTSPLEVVATLQMSGMALSNGGLVSQLTHLYNAQGIGAFWRGNGANCLKVAPTRAIQFAVYERVKVAILKRQQARAPPGTEVTLSPYGRLVAGGLAGMVACSIVYPLEVIKTMLTVSPPGTYNGICDAFLKALASGGIGGFYKGWLPTMFAMFPYVGVEFMVYETLKQGYSNLAISRGLDAAHLPALVHIAIGACAGASSQTAAHPLDVVRRRLQMQGKNGRPVEFSNMFEGLYKIGRKDGFAGLYRGLRPACAEKIPSTAVTFFAYGFLKELLGLTSV